MKYFEFYVVTPYAEYDKKCFEAFEDKEINREILEEHASIFF